MWISSFPREFVEETIISPLNGLGIPVKNRLTTPSEKFVLTALLNVVNSILSAISKPILSEHLFSEVLFTYLSGHLFIICCLPLECKL